MISLTPFSSQVISMSQSEFDKAWDIIGPIEGGYVDDPDDPGGKTRWGVTEAVARAHGYKGDMKDYPKEEAQRVAKESYWDACRCNEIHWPVNLYLFDMAYNSGPVQAIKTLQRTIGVSDDGIMGPKTMGAIHDMSRDKEELFLSDRAMFYTILAGFRKYGRGWFKRLFHLVRVS